MKLIPEVKTMPTMWSVQAMTAIAALEGVWQVPAVQAVLPEEYKALATGLLAVIGVFGRAFVQGKP